MLCPKCKVQSVTVWMMQSSFEGCPVCKEDVTRVKVDPPKPSKPTGFEGSRFDPTININDRVMLSPKGRNSFGITLARSIGIAKVVGVAKGGYELSVCPGFLFEAEDLIKAC
jgi:hypothetical protein